MGMTVPNSQVAGTGEIVDPRLFADQQAMSPLQYPVTPPRMDAQGNITDTSQQAKPYQPPELKTPSYQEAAGYGATPGGANAMSPALTKGGKLLTILQAGLRGALAGRAAQEQMIAASGGRRAGGVGTGFMAGLTLPWQMAQQEAQARLAQYGAQPVQTEYGTMPAAYLPKFISPMLHLQGVRETNQSKADIADRQMDAHMAIAAQDRASREKIAEGAQRYKAVSGVGLYNTQSGQLEVSEGAPITQEIIQAYGLPPNMLGLPLTPRSVALLQMAQARMAPTVGTHQQVIEDQFGQLHPVTLSSTSQKILPFLQGAGGAPPAPPKIAAPAGTPAPQAPKASPKAAARTGGTAPAAAGPILPFSGKSGTQWMVGTDPEGNQVAGSPAELQAAGVKDMTKLPADKQSQTVTARQLIQPNGLFNLVQNDLSKFTPEELNGIGNRLQEFRLGSWIPQLATGQGADPRYVTLRTHLNGLTSTAVMQAHVGQRGGEHMTEHFEDLATAKKFTLDNLKSAVAAEKEYIAERAMLPKKQGAAKPAADPLGILK